MEKQTAGGPGLGGGGEIESMEHMSGSFGIRQAQFPMSKMTFPMRMGKENSKPLKKNPTFEGKSL